MIRYDGGLFTVGVAIVHGNNYDAANALADYSYINAGSRFTYATIIRIMTGLGPSGTSTNANAVLGGVYFNGTRMPDRPSCYPEIITVEPGLGTAGVFNVHQCLPFSIAYEGIYTCMLKNSSLMYQSIRFGMYFPLRSESFT